jgi:hypothetical protein
MKIASYIPFTQKIPSNDQYTDFLLDILTKLEEGEVVQLSKKERKKLVEILDCSFNQVEILDKEEENTPFYAGESVFKKGKK